MPAKSRRQRVQDLERELLSTDRLIDALLVVQDEEGNELGRTGGRWDPTTRTWDRNADVVPLIIRLQPSQLEAWKGFADWLESSRRGEVDPQRAIVLLLGGARGGGKTWFVALMIVFIGLEWMNEWQYSVNLSTSQRREVIEGIEECTRPEWIEARSDDPREPWLRFIGNSTVRFVSARNPRRLREAKLRIRAVHINEAQDQDQDVYINGVSATRNVDGLTTIASNRPRDESGDWVSLVATAIQGCEVVGRVYIIDPRKNRAVSRVALDKRAAAVRAVDERAAIADTDPDAPMLMSGPIAYPAFVPLPREKNENGHISLPLAPVFDLDGRLVAPGWTDVTTIETAKALDPNGNSVGFPWIIGVDFQRVPGIVGAVAKLYRDERGRLILCILDQVAVRGVEPDFSQALISAGFAPAHGMVGSPVLLIGDATGARQNSEHKFSQPTSYLALRAEGWKIIPPMRHWRHGTPWNPLVKDSRRQMHWLFEQHLIQLAPKCKEAHEGFPSLVESFRRAKIGPRGGLVDEGNFQHGPDGVRYLACLFMPRPKPAPSPRTIDPARLDAFAGVKILSS